MNKNKTGVYKITNKITKELYIGSTSSGKGFEYRWKARYNKFFERAKKKYGKQNFLYEVVCFCYPEECLKYEQYYLDHYQPFPWTGKGYNICEKAGNTKGRICRKETRDKISKALSGEKHLYFGKSSPAKGHKFSQESIKKLKKAHEKFYMAIERINKITGEVKEYFLLKEAVKDGFSSSSIRRCCLGTLKSHKNFYWQYLEPQKHKTHKNINMKKRSIERINKITGEVKEYESISSAVKDGFDAGNIYNAIFNKHGTKTHKGFFWQYLNKEENNTI